MFDLGASELLLTAIVAIVVIGPKDMPVALRMAGRWIAKMRKISGHFRSGIDAMVREAELEEMEKKWREQNEAIMKASPQLPSMHPSADDMQPPATSNASVASTPPSSMPEELGKPEETQTTRQAEVHAPPPPP